MGHSILLCGMLFYVGGKVILTVIFSIYLLVSVLMFSVLFYQVLLSIISYSFIKMTTSGYRLVFIVICYLISYALIYELNDCKLILMLY